MILGSRIINILRIFLKESSLELEEIANLRDISNLEVELTELLNFLEIGFSTWVSLSVKQQRTLVVNFLRGRP